MALTTRLLRMSRHHGAIPPRAIGTEAFRQARADGNKNPATVTNFGFTIPGSHTAAALGS